MKQIAIITLCCATLRLSALEADSLQQTKKSLRDSICTRWIIEPERTSAGNSKLYHWADSLNQMCTLNEKLQNFRSSNYTLKYYSYIAVLHYSDSLGLILLKESHMDTTTLSYFQSCTIQELKLNEMMYEDYKLKLRYKYKPGVFNTGSPLPLEYSLTSQNNRLYRRKMKEVVSWWKKAHKNRE